MAVNLSPVGGVAAQFFDNNGVPLSGGFLYTYAAGTSTPQATYTSSSGSIAQANPIVLDSSGRVPSGEIWLTDGLRYKFVLQNANAVLIGTYDNIIGIGDTSAFTASSGSSLIGYQPAGAGAVSTTVQTKLRQTVSVYDFIPLGTNIATAPCYTFIQAAHDSIVASGIPGVLDFGNGGSFLMGGPITVNAGFVSMRGERAILDFTTAGNIACVTINGGNGASTNPYNQSDFTFSGFKLLGPTTGVGIYLNQLTVGSSLGPAHLAFRDLNIQYFTSGVRCGNHAYLNQFDHCDFLGCDVGFFLAATDLLGNAVIDVGALYTMTGGVFYNCKVNIQQQVGSANLSCFGVTMGETSLGVAGVNVIVENTGAKVAMFGCHFESEGKAATVGANTFLELYGCSFIAVTSTIDKYINNFGFLVIDGGLAGGAGFTTGTNLIFNNVGGRAKIQGLHVIGSSSSVYNLTAGNYLLYEMDANVFIGNGEWEASSMGGDQTLLVSQFSVTCTVLNTWVDTGVGAAMGMYVVRDSTLGGMALFLADINGVVAVSNSITGLEMRYNGGSSSFQFRVTSGTVPRLLSFGAVETV